MIGEVGPKCAFRPGFGVKYSPVKKNRAVVTASTRHRTSEHATSATRLSRKRMGGPKGATAMCAMERMREARARGGGAHLSHINASKTSVSKLLLYEEWLTRVEYRLSEGGW